MCQGGSYLNHSILVIHPFSDIRNDPGNGIKEDLGLFLLEGNVVRVLCVIVVFVAVGFLEAPVFEGAIGGP